MAGVGNPKVSKFRAPCEGRGNALYWKLIVWAPESSELEVNHKKLKRSLMVFGLVVVDDRRLPVAHEVVGLLRLWPGVDGSSDHGVLGVSSRLTGL